MAKRLIVTILAPTFGPNGEKRNEWLGAIGTGIAVRDDLILTSRHVVRPKKRDAEFPIKVRWYEFCKRGDPFDGWVDLDKDDNIAIPWAGGDKLDTALIRCPIHPEAQKIRKPAIAASLPKGGSGWDSRGFPNVTNIDKLRQEGDFFGTVCVPTPSDLLLKLKNEFQTDSEEGWGGASGMPVIVNGEIAGVVKDVPRNFKTQLFEAVPAYRLRQDAEFCKWLGFDTEPDLLKTAHGLMVALLQTSESATCKLAEYFGIDSVQSGECRNQVADEALKTDLDELFNIALDAQQALNDAGDHIGADVIARLVQVLLPALHQSGDAEAIRLSHAAKSGVLHEIHACHKTIAELVMARADCRPAAYNRPGNPNEFPSAIPCLPYPPEGGRDSKGRQFQRDLTEEIAQKVEVLAEGPFKGRFVRYLRGRFTDPNMALDTDEALNYWINDGLSRDAKRQAKHNRIRGYTYYFLLETPSKLDPAQRTAQDAIMAELAIRFPEIAFIRLSPPDPLLRELQPYSLLRDLLYANPEQRQWNSSPSAPTTSKISKT